MWLVSPQPWQNITYLGAQGLEARQGADCHTLVIHAAALGTGQHVHETVHLGCRAALCMKQRPWGRTQPGRRPQPIPPPPLTFSRKHAHICPQPADISVPTCLLTFSDPCPLVPQMGTCPIHTPPSRPLPHTSLPALTALGGWARPRLQ